LWTALELWTKEKLKREPCFTVVFKFEFKAQLLMTFECDCKLWVKKTHLRCLDPLSIVSSKDHMKRTTSKVDVPGLCGKVLVARWLQGWLL